MEIKNVVEKLEEIKKTIQAKMEKGELLEDVKRYADTQLKVLKEKLGNSPELQKVITALDERKKQFEKMAQAFPKDVEAFRGYLEAQRKDLDKLAKTLLRKIQLAPRRLRKHHGKSMIEKTMVAKTGEDKISA